MNSGDDFIGPVNIGNPSEFTMLELAELIKAKTNSDSEMVHKPLPVNDPTQRKPDITIAKEQLGWEPTIDLETGITKTVAYFSSIVGKSFKAAA